MEVMVDDMKRLMKGRGSCEMAWNIVEGFGFHQQVVGLEDRIKSLRLSGWKIVSRGEGGS